MFTCDEVRYLADSWEREGKTDPASLRRLQGHLQVCTVCRKHYGELMRLFERDSRAPVPRTRHPQTNEKLTQRIMDAVYSVPGGAPSKKRFFIPAAAAAALMIVLGTAFLISRMLPREVSDMVTVRFQLYAPGVSNAVLVGDFTNWEKDKIILHDDDNDGIWQTEILLKKGNLYQYNFVIDDEEWITDPESLISIDDGFGGRVSLLQI